MIIYDVIKKPLITEKTTAEKDAHNVVVFVVNKDANKIEIKIRWKSFSRFQWRRSRPLMLPVR